MEKTKIMKENNLTAYYSPLLRTCFFLAWGSYPIPGFFHPTGSHSVFKIELKKILLFQKFFPVAYCAQLCYRTYHTGRQLFTWLFPHFSETLKTWGKGT